MFEIGPSALEIKLSNSRFIKDFPRNRPQTDYHLSILVTGQPKSGKTALVKQLVDQEFTRVLTFWNGTQVGYFSNGEKTITLDVSDEDDPNCNKNFYAPKSYQQTAICIVIDLSKKMTEEKLRNWIASKIEQAKCLHPEAMIVLVGNKVDKQKKMMSEMLRNAATINKISLALVSTKESILTNELITLLLDQMVTQVNIKLKEADAKQALHAVNQSNSNGSRSGFFAPKINAFIVKDYNQIIVDRIAELEKELFSTFAANKPRKLQKLYGLKELLWLLEKFPDQSIATHIAAVREKYKDKGLDEGVESATKALLDAIVKETTMEKSLSLRFS